MPTIEMLSQRAEPVLPTTPSSEVFARFVQAPDVLVVPVVEADGRPVGLVERDAFLLKIAGAMGSAQSLGRPISLLMDPEPAVVEAGVKIDVFGDMLMRGGAGSMMRGFIVTHLGRYRGVGTSVSMLQAINERQRQRNDELAEQLRVLSDSDAQNAAAARAKSQFLGVMSHELRTPMNGVLAVAELLRRQPLNAAAQAHVQTIVDSSESLLRILSDAVDLAKAEAGELELTPGVTPLRAMMDEIQNTWVARAGENGVTLHVSYEGDTELAAQIDGGRLRQVFNNLVGNALKFARDGVVEASLKAWS
ncbi:MAG: response regulator receiver protein, partial [Brevundimonas sp.]